MTMRLALTAAVLMTMPALGLAQAPPRRLIMPFENATREPGVQWLAEGSAAILADDLLALGVPAITRTDRLRAFDRLHVPAAADLSYATVIRVGRILGAGQVIVGAFEVSGEQITVRARAIELGAGRMLPEIVESGPLRDIFAVYGRVARQLAPDAPAPIAEMEQGHPPIAAFEQYSKGLIAQAPAAKIAFLTQAIRLAPGFQRPRLELWEVHTDQGDHTRALAAVAEVPPTHALARQAKFLAGLSQLHLGRLQDAFATFSALQQQRTDSALMNNLGIVQLRRSPEAGGGRAVWYFNEAARLDPGDPDLLFNLGYAYWLDRDPAAAIYWLREAVRRNPSDDAAHYVLGVALQATGSAAEASREKELARRLSSEYAQWESKQKGANGAPRGLERIKTDLDVPSALRVDTVIVEAGRRDQRELAEFHLAAGRRALEGERYAEAIAELRRAIYLAPYDHEAHLLLGRAYMRGGRLQDAIDAFKISLWSEPTIAAHLALAEAYIQTRDFMAARLELQQIFNRQPGHPDARRLLESLPPP